jgi:hypothetical protein
METSISFVLVSRPIKHWWRVLRGAGGAFARGFPDSDWLIVAPTTRLQSAIPQLSILASCNLPFRKAEEFIDGLICP